MVKHLHTLSNATPTPVGVPQGAVLCPTLSNIIINDLTFHPLNNINYSKYADDLALWTSDKQTSKWITNLQLALNHLVNWTQAWGLSIAPSKTKAIFFSRRKTPNTTLKIGNIPIEYSKSHKFLGLTMDRNLTWKPHIQDLKKKCTSDVKLLRTLSKIHWGAEFKVLRTLYTALILPKLNYGSFLYDTAAKSNLAILDSIQNHALRTMLGSLRCTRIEHMQVLANIPPLYINRKIQLFDYSARTMAISSNPI